MRTLVLGGIRSGKSRHAESLLTTAGQVSYLATATSRPDDPEWTERIRTHRQRRPGSWHTVECGSEPDSVPGLLSAAGPGAAVLLDDLGGWVTALQDAAGWRAGVVEEPLHRLVAAIRDGRGDIVLVSPEVGLTVVPAVPVARRFVDVLGRVNQAVAGVCDRVVLVVAGQPLWIKGGPGTSLTP